VAFPELDSLVTQLPVKASDACSDAEFYRPGRHQTGQGAAEALVVQASQDMSCLQ